VQYDGVDLGTAAERGPREPHRHDYHELIWTRSGDVTQLLDGKPLSVAPRTLTLIGRGQVHIFERAREFHGAVARFGEQLLHAGPSARASGLVAHRPRRAHRRGAGRGGPRLEATIATLAAEAQRSADACSIDVQCHPWPRCC
jgi:AraC family transcriptional activator of pobA